MCPLMVNVKVGLVVFQAESARCVAALARREEKKGVAFMAEQVTGLNDVEERIKLPFYQVNCWIETY